eukprot:CAMPEP_0194308406 /NCGR_PEP_ID=MMETSP0171-20130528/5376_1 /TAXON_ID=218684 /ORGANISM="Corethron pennatum, Strain L29A3" /LENGTH=41 /DNA_ID= /DNA_START= /DNA_END= /DNA_ORIENTATION=
MGVLGPHLSLLSSSTASDPRRAIAAAIAGRELRLYDVARVL